MSNVNLVVGDDGSNALQGTNDRDLIYGFDPAGAVAQADLIGAVRVATGLSQPLFAVSPPNDASRLFIVEKQGQIKILDLASQQVRSKPFLDVSTQIKSDGEQGLLGMAFDPAFSENGFFYVTLTNLQGNTEIRRYQLSSPNLDVVDLGSAATIITIPQQFTNHKGGWLAFGSDNLLYAALGDGGGSGDPNNSAQNIDSLLGKILRLDVHADDFPSDAGRNYGIPSDNPFVNAAGADEVWALGFRNPWRPSFDRGLDDLYIADVGNASWEEIDIGQIGGNYGWKVFEGPEIFAGGTPGPGILTEPIYSYDRSVGQSITGGYVYRGESDGLQGQYFFADFVAGKVFTLRNQGTSQDTSWVATERTSQITTNIGAINNPTSFGQDGIGNLYIVDLDGDVFRLTPSVTSLDQADDISGLAGNDLMFGGAGNDTLQGGEGADELHGGSGNDLLNGGSGADLLSGDTGDDILTGGPDADSLVGGMGADQMSGGPGDDVYVVDGVSDTVVEAADEGIDQIRTSLANYSLASLPNIENLGGDGANQTLTGNAAANAIVAGSGSDSLIGGAGADVLRGGAGNDSLSGGSGEDTISGGSHSDRFVFDAATLADAVGAGRIADFVTDFDQGNLAGYNFTEADTLDLTAIVDSAFNNGHLAGRLVRAIDDPFTGKAIVQVDANGATGGQQWTTIAKLDGIHSGDWLKVAFTDSFTQQMGVREGLGLMKDFSGDGKTDILWRNDDGTVALWTMNGGTIAQNNTLSAPPIEWHLSATDDFNGDGKTDILWRYDLGQVAIWTMNGGSITSNVTVASPGSQWHTVGTGDFGGDGKADVLWRSDGGEVVLWQMNGTAVASNTTVTNLVANDWRILETADFDGDGRQDILWRGDSGAAAVWTMNGASVSGSATLSGPDQRWHILASADFGGDGKADILWRHDNGSVALWQMNGTAIANNSMVSTTVPSDWHIVSTADFDSDNKEDIVWRHDSGEVAIWTMNGSAVSGNVSLGNPGLDWHIAGLGDLNGDQKADIQWRHDSGQVATWQMEGASVITNTMGPTVGTDWATITHHFELM